jgi:sporulation protein YlmC with PRC-barrel domain
MLRMKKISETANLKAYTDDGLYFGDIEDAIVNKNKVESWKVKASRDSFLAKALAGAKGVIVPHQLVRAIGDIMIVSKAAAPSYSEEESTST